MGVKIRAVASLERTIVIPLPKRKVLSRRSFELPLASRADCAANQSKRPAASASAERDIMPRKKKKVFQSPVSVVRASRGLMRPMIRSSAAPTTAIIASFNLNGRTIMPISVNKAISEMSSILVSVGR